MSRRWTAVAAVGLTWACVAADPPPATGPSRSTFVRYADDGHGGGQMQAAVASYVNDATGVTVDLVSTVHIGDTAFFRQLAGRLRTYDAVLYELVGRRGEPATEEGVNPQQGRIAGEMGLENQGPHMNYDRPSFVHADLDLEDLQQRETAAHGTTKGMLGEGPGLAAARGPQDTAGVGSVYADTDAAKAVRRSNPKEFQRLMRRAYARILSVTAEPAAGSTYPAGADMDVLVGARNEHVMAVLGEQVGHGKRHVAVLYGAAHMADLEHRLLAAGYRQRSIQWQTAWTVADDGTPTTRPASGRR